MTEVCSRRVAELIGTRAQVARPQPWRKRERAEAGWPSGRHSRHRCRGRADGCGGWLRSWRRRPEAAAATRNYCPSDLILKRIYLRRTATIAALPQWGTSQTGARKSLAANKAAPIFGFTRWVGGGQRAPRARGVGWVGRRDGRKTGGGWVV
eukprot:COSAG06_NODE_1953_length_7994_cov_40.573583_4_plen_152_part_00